MLRWRRTMAYLDTDSAERERLLPELASGSALTWWCRVVCILWLRTR